MLVALFSVIAYFWKSEVELTKPISNNNAATVQQTTFSDYSPAISGTKGNVNFNINSPDSGKQPK